MSMCKGSARRTRLPRSLFGAAIVAQLAVAPSAARAATGPRIDSLSLSRPSVSVSGMALARVTLTTRVSDWPAETEPQFAFLDPTDAAPAGGPWDLTAALRLISGAPGNGIYQGTAYVPSSAGGRWRVAVITSVVEPDDDLPPATAVDPRDDGLRDVVLTVQGAHPPTLRLSVLGAARGRNGDYVLRYPAGGSVTIIATLTDHDTGRPLAHMPVWVTDSTVCYQEAHNFTDLHGRLAMKFTDQPYDICAGTSFPAFATNSWDPSYNHVSMEIRYTVQLRVALRHFVTHHAALRRVEGNVLAVGKSYEGFARAAACGVVLQRAVGRTWRTVNRSAITSSGRYHLAAPAGHARNVYHIWFPSCLSLVGTTSRSFAISALHEVLQLQPAR